VCDLETSRMGASYIYDISRLSVNELYSSANIFQVLKSRITRWAGHVACMGERKSVYRVLVVKPEVKSPFERPRNRWEDKLKWIFRKWDVETWTGSTWLSIGTGGGHLRIAFGNEPSGSIKCREFLD